MTAELRYRALCISDLARSTRFYRDGLGFMPVGEPEAEAGGWLDQAAGTEGARLSSQLVRNDQGITLKLYEFGRPEAFGPRERRKNNQFGLTHLAFYVDDINAQAARIEAAGGFVFPHTRATFRDNGTTMMYSTDPDGIRVELMQAPGERQRFSHSGICMDDVDAWIRFYAQVFGFAEAENYELFDHGYFMNLINELDDVKTRAQMIRNPNRDTIELLSMVSPPSFGSKEPPAINQYGLRYLSFGVPDVVAAAAQIKSLGGTALTRPSTDSNGHLRAFCADPVGVRLELVA
jgi:catechol 2,3-dioxygenase-like lactoylglutathione lyase family enzyme